VPLCLRLPGGLERLPATLVAAWIARDCRVLCEPTAPDAVSVLVFSPNRYREDLEVLAKTGVLRLIATPTETLQRVNSLFPTMPSIDESDRYDYFRERDPRLLEGRKKLQRFCAAVLQALARKLEFDCAITPAVHYRNEHPWAAACDGLGIPFIAVHKEFTILAPRHLPARIERFRKQGRRFDGTRVLVINETARELFTGCGMIEAERIEVVGMPRMDRLFDSQSPLRRKMVERPQVTLFSFTHFSGDLEPGKRRSKLFSADDREGFVRLFRNVHVGIAELALKHPEVSFKIKPKIVTDWWIVEIERVIKEALGKNLDDIPNCAVVSERAPELIRDSEVVIGFNSTVLLESLALGRPTIVPLFDEAVDSYPDNVYLRESLDAFTIAHSKQELIALIEKGIAGTPLGPAPNPERLKRCFETYFGFYDDQSAMRVAEALRRRQRANTGKQAAAKRRGRMPRDAPRFRYRCRGLHRLAPGRAAGRRGLCGARAIAVQRLRHTRLARPDRAC